jgi:hypothetical protein
VFARHVGEGACGGSYGDAVLILSAILSSLAAGLWPGEGKDRRRFVEIWAAYSAPDLKPNLISVPRLLASLEKEGHHDLVKKVRSTHPRAFTPYKIDTLVVTGEDVDKTEDKLVALVPELDAWQLRKFSYGDVFYRNVRSGYIHLYRLKEYAREYSMADKTGSISYVNVNNLPYRPIYFPISWVADLVESVLTRVTSSGGKQPLPNPQSWWVDGRTDLEEVLY